MSTQTAKHAVAIEEYQGNVRWRRRGGAHIHDHAVRALADELEVGVPLAHIESLPSDDFTHLGGPLSFRSRVRE